MHIMAHIPDAASEAAKPGTHEPTPTCPHLCWKPGVHLGPLSVLTRGIFGAAELRLLRLIARTGPVWDALEDPDTALAVLHFLAKMLQVGCRY